jgi:formamidopyrimidine-DNA glycosylase
MSFEYPEARLLSRQLDETIKGKTVESYDLKDYEKIHRTGFINWSLDDFKWLVGRRIEGAGSSGNTIRVQLEGGMNLLLAPEYGGVILYHRSSNDVSKYHLKLDFSGGDSLTVRLTSMGVIYATLDDRLDGVYIYKRDYLGAPSPVNLTREQFAELITSKATQLKPLLVGKDAIMTGLSNSAFQDVLYRAGIHPRRKSSELTLDEVDALYSAISHLVEERLRLGGKDEIVDLFGKRGGYVPTMGPNMKDRDCQKCGGKVEKMALGGGQVYYCPSCQRAPR